MINLSEFSHPHHPSGVKMLVKYIRRGISVTHNRPSWFSGASMKYRFSLIASALLIVLTPLVACAPDGTSVSQEETDAPSLLTTDDAAETGDGPTLLVEEDMVYQGETAPAPPWIPANVGGGTPWFDDLQIATSGDGLNFDNNRLFLPHAGVGNLLLTRNNILIASFQYFSYTNEELFDRIAYAVSEDFGRTWSPVRPMNIEVPDPGPHPVDPTLVQLSDGGFRLYFTFHQRGDEFPQLFSAQSDTIDGLFRWEGKQLSTEQLILDPAVIFFNNVWHHYTTSHEAPKNGIVNNVHSISSDGLNFVRQDDIAIEMSFLGNLVEVYGGLRFYGGQSSAFTTDGYHWEMEPGNRGLGGDPGVVALPDGSYLAVFTDVGGK